VAALQQPAILALAGVDVLRHSLPAHSVLAERARHAATKVTDLPVPDGGRPRDNFVCVVTLMLISDYELLTHRKIPLQSDRLRTDAKGIGAFVKCVFRALGITASPHVAIQTALCERDRLRHLAANAQAPERPAKPRSAADINQLNRYLAATGHWDGYLAAIGFCYERSERS
jgi:hypothetical protein